LNFEVTVDFVFFGMTAASLFVIRRHHIGAPGNIGVYRTPGHPFTTAIFVLSCLGIVVSAIIASPRNSAIALCIMLGGLPIYYFWKKSGHVSAVPH
jgi:APA family basic amino acid/polyamine antiporter